MLYRIQVMSLDQIVSRYIHLKAKDETAMIINLVFALSHAQRKQVRAELEQLGIPVTRSLYYDYEKQVWID